MELSLQHCAVQQTDSKWSAMHVLTPSLHNWGVLGGNHKLSLRIESVRELPVFLVRLVGKS